MKSQFFNPWDERVARDIEAADARRRAEIAKPETKPEAPIPAEPLEPKVKVSRAAARPNERGLACPVCGGVPATIRNDGVRMARHKPFREGVKLYRDTEFCDGQGREGTEGGKAL